MNALSRRRFLKISAATFGAGAAATQIPPLTHLAHAAAPPGEVKTVATFCEMCFWRCAGIASVRDGKVWKFEGNPIDPQSRGRLCPRGSGAPGAINDPDRLRTPLIRTGERGKQAWKTATWDEALTHVADRMQKIKGAHGPESIAMLYHGIGVRFIQHVLKSYGCINMAGASFAQCRGPRDVGFYADLRPGPRFARADRHREHRLPRADRLAPRREHAQPAGAGVLERRGAPDPDHRRRPALLGGGEQGEVLAADQAGHRPRAAARVDERPRDRRLVRQDLRRAVRARLREVRRGDQVGDARVGGHRDRPRPGADPRDRARVLAAPAGVADPPGPARQLVRRRRAAQPRGGAAQRAARQLGPARRHPHAERHQGRGLPAAEVPGAAASRSPTTRTARSIRSPTNRSPPGSGKPPSPASRTRSRAGSSTRRTSSRRCRTAPRPSRRSTASTCWSSSTPCRARSPATRTSCCRSRCSSSATTSCRSAGAGAAGCRCGSRSSRRPTSRSPAGGSRSNSPTSSGCPRSCRSTTSRST